MGLMLAYALRPCKRMEEYWQKNDIGVLPGGTFSGLRNIFENMLQNANLKKRVLFGKRCPIGALFFKKCVLFHLLKMQHSF
jgi:hypothetical protein